MKTSLRSNEIGISCPKTRSGRLKLSNGWLDGEYDPEIHTEYPSVEITQCQISSCEVMLNTNGRLGKQTSDLKIIIAKFTYPGQSSYTPSLSPSFSLEWMYNGNNKVSVAGCTLVRQYFLFLRLTETLTVN